MFYIKFCVKYGSNFGCFLKIHIAFYKHILHINNGNNAQKHYLPIKLLLNLLAASFVEKTRYLSIFFSNSEFGMRVYKGKIEARSEDISLYTFLRISSRKINTLKRTKLNQVEINEVDDMNIKITTAQHNENFEIYYKNIKKMKKNKSAQNFVLFKYVIECFKTSTFHY